MTEREVETKRVDMCGYMLYTSKQPTLYGAHGFTICNTSYISAGGRRSPAVACWASDHWVASSNPLRGKFRH